MFELAAITYEYGLSASALLHRNMLVIMVMKAKHLLASHAFPIVHQYVQVLKKKAMPFL